MDASREAEIRRQAREQVVRELEQSATEAFREAHALSSRASAAASMEHEPSERALAEAARAWGARGDVYQQLADQLKGPSRVPEGAPAPTAPPVDPEAPSDDELLWFLLDKRVATSRDFGERWPKAQLRNIGRRLGELAAKGVTYSNSRGYGLTAKGATLARARGLVAATEVGAAASPMPPKVAGGRR